MPIDRSVILDGSSIRPGAIVKESTLYCKHGTSDKVYKVSIVKSDVVVGRWMSYHVQTEHGRRGGRLRPGKGNHDGWSLATAERKYDEIIDQKLAKGYVDYPS